MTCYIKKKTDKEIEKMIDEEEKELADKSACAYFGKAIELVDVQKLGLYKDGFLAGLKTGRPQWHDLRKDPNDLPDEGTYLVVWQNNKGYKEIFIIRYEEDDEEELHWVDGDCENQDEYIIAWCEIPTFDKE